MASEAEAEVEAEVEVVASEEAEASEEAVAEDSVEAAVAVSAAVAHQEVAQAGPESSSAQVRARCSERLLTRQ